MNSTDCSISILFVIDGLEFGGGERTFLQLIQGLPCERYAIHVATSPEGDFFKILTGMGIDVVPLDLRKRVSVNNIKKLSGIIRKRKIDIVHSQGGRSDFYARIAARRLKPKIKIVNTVAMPVKGYDVSALRKGAYRFFDWVSERYADRFIVVSEVLKETLLNSYRIPPDKVIKIYNGIELNEYRPNGKEVRSQKSEVRREFGLSKDAPVIGAIGRMVWQKGFEYLIECIPEIVRTYPDAKILIVGDGPLRERLGALSEELGVRDNVIFAGFRSDIKEILSAVDLLVVPSLLEGFPMVTLEAMAMAKPIVATNIDGITEQITDGIDGILVSPRDPSTLAKAVIRVLNDNELVRTMGLSARERVEQDFSVEKMVAETEKVYMSLHYCPVKLYGST
ncbi:MAG: glycosyltransferase family 4 protein [Deltaproteobacteria bacterium]|nr:glycosyltransferase family 4 protein [Deltaproteobacteria bacterium]